MSKLLVDEISDADNTGPVTVTDGLTVQGAFTSLGIDDNATSTAMTLDASGNLLVGKTINDNGATEGIELEAGGQLNVTIDGSFSRFNRLTSDGDILSFRKDGTTVGSIGNSGGANIAYFAGAATGVKILNPSTGLDTLAPSTATGGNRNGSMDLGANGVAFKDLYLSGGVYLGGTGAANKLDDYEEGTWVPALTGATGVTYGSQSGYYTKVGNVITIGFYMNITTAPTGTNMYVAFPFGGRGGVTSLHGARLLMSSGLTSGNRNKIYLSPYSTSAAFYFYDDTGGVYNYTSAFQVGVISACMAYTTA